MRQILEDGEEVIGFFLKVVLRFGHFRQRLVDA